MFGKFLKNFILILFLFVYFVQAAFAQEFYNELKCDISEGYTQIEYGRCYNPDNKLSYEKNYLNEHIFYISGNKCGRNCDFEGRNCQVGICNVKDCPHKQGYSEMDNKGRCYNPKKDLAFTWEYRDVSLYYHSGDVLAFYKNDKFIGYDCAYNGRSCKYKPGFQPKNLSLFFYLMFSPQLLPITLLWLLPIIIPIIIIFIILCRKKD